MKSNLIIDKTLRFSLLIIDTYKQIAAEKKEYVLSKQMLRSGTSIGANIREANFSISKKEFIMKVQIALKEASETEYWLILLKESGYISNCEIIFKEVREIIKILTSILKTSKDRLNDKH
ncbi:MAG: four helix bundle protein [Candidatus Cloacimonetes bacterium]|nr:four helix bundle protein [Candidatus Cloacimonadota bacterium]